MHHYINPKPLVHHPIIQRRCFCCLSFKSNVHIRLLQHTTWYPLCFNFKILLLYSTLTILYNYSQSFPMALVLHMQDPFKKTWTPRKAWKRSSNAVLGPKSPAKIPITANKGKLGRLKSVAEFYAGSSTFATSPPPSSLPIPSFVMKEKQSLLSTKMMLQVTEDF